MAILTMIMERVAPGNHASCFKLWACRGEGRGCTRNRYRAQKKHCEDCAETLESETIAELQARLARGDG
jgi:hypothetical protein